MNRSTLKRFGCLYALLAFSGSALIDAGSALAQTTNSTGAQTRPESPGQVSPNNTTKPQNTSAFTPRKPGAKPTPPASDNSKKEK